jgi:DNA-binding transcriptional regulator GbsR (MarR family)
MNAILNNPYRLLGLLVGASATQLNRHRTRISNYISADNEIPAEYTYFSFQPLGIISRTEENIANAASKLSLDNDKMSSALFWFYKGNPITDEPAFEAIKEADLDQVISIWTKLTSNGEVSQRNASAYSNLGTLYLSGILEGTNTNEALLEQGISLKLKFLESDYIKDFKALATDETYKTSKKELQLLFLSQVQSEIEKSGGVTSNEFLDIITKQEFSAKEDYLKGFVQKPIEQIEKKIEETKSKRKVNKANSIKAANSLLAETKDSIKQLKSILGVSNIRYSSIADKLAMEFFACGRDYFMHLKDTDTDPSDYSMKLFKKAKSYAIGNIAKQQIDENIKDLQEWIDDKPERDKQKKVEEDLKFITSKLDRFQNIPDTVSNAKDLVDSCKPKLANIKSVLGSTDDFYLKISNAVANNALGMLVTAVNEAQESIEVKIGDFTALRSVVRSALSVSESIGSFDLVSSQRTHYSKNHTALKSIASKLGVSSSSSPSSSTSTHGPSTSSSSSSEEGIPDWLKWVGGIIFFIILIKACN